MTPSFNGSGAVAIGVGTATAMFGVIDQNTWAVCTGAAIGAGTVVWTFGYWLRDRTLVYLRNQAKELADELELITLNRQKNIDQQIVLLRDRLDEVLRDRDREIERSNQMFDRFSILVRMIEENGIVQDNEKYCG